MLRWGLVPSWAKSPDTGLKMINARLETATEKPAFRRAFERFRCLIVADGFYEWRRGPSPTGGPKQPFHITRDDGQPFAFAGLWSIWHAEDGDTLRTCTILTTAANSAIASLHDRMPVILDPGAESAWLDTSPRRARSCARSSPACPPQSTAVTRGRLRRQRRALRRPGVPGAAGAQRPGSPLLDRGRATARERRR